jgi:hypothetical protein
MGVWLTFFTDAYIRSAAQNFPSFLPFSRPDPESPSWRLLVRTVGCAVLALAAVLISAFVYYAFRR